MNAPRDIYSGLVGDIFSPPASAPHRTSPSTSSSQKASFVTQLNPNDVLVGRGAPSIDNEGNIRFRQIVQNRKPEYVAASKRQYKDWIAREVIQTVAARQGRFLRKIESLVEAEGMGVPEGTTAWAFVDDETILQKVKQALRDREMSTSAEGDEAKRESITMSGSAADGASSPVRRRKRTRMVIPTTEEPMTSDTVTESQRSAPASTTATFSPGREVGPVHSPSAAISSSPNVLVDPARMLAGLSSEEARASQARAVLDTFQGMRGAGGPLGGGPFHPSLPAHHRYQQHRQQQMLSPSDTLSAPLHAPSASATMLQHERDAAAAMAAVMQQHQQQRLSIPSSILALAAAGGGVGSNVALSHILEASGLFSQLRGHPDDSLHQARSSSSLIDLTFPVPPPPFREATSSGSSNRFSAVASSMSLPASSRAHSLLPSQAAAAILGRGDIPFPLMSGVVGRGNETSEEEQVQLLKLPFWSSSTQAPTPAATARSTGSASAGTSSASAAPRTSWYLGTTPEIPLHEETWGIRTIRRALEDGLRQAERTGSRVSREQMRQAPSSCPLLSHSNTDRDLTTGAANVNPTLSLNLIEMHMLRVLCTWGLPVWIAPGSSPSSAPATIDLTGASNESTTSSHRFHVGWSELSRSLIKIAKEHLQRERAASNVSRRDLSVEERALQLAASYNADMEEFARRMVTLLEKVASIMVVAKEPETESDTRGVGHQSGPTTEQEQIGIGESRLIESWFKGELYRWASSLELLDPSTDRPASYTSFDFIWDFPELAADRSVLPVAILNRQGCCAVVFQVAYLSRLRSTICRAHSNSRQDGGHHFLETLQKSFLYMAVRADEAPETPATATQSITVSGRPSKRSHSALQQTMTWPARPLWWGQPPASSSSAPLATTSSSASLPDDPLLHDRILLETVVLHGYDGLSSHAPAPDQAPVSYQQLGLSPVHLQQRIQQLTLRMAHLEAYVTTRQQVLQNRAQAYLMDAVARVDRSGPSPAPNLPGALSVAMAAAAQGPTTSNLFSRASSLGSIASDTAVQNAAAALLARNLDASSERDANAEGSSQRRGTL